jgi:predicted amidohydrolase YtcJ
VPGAQNVDLAGRTVIPGFFDAHNHYTRAAVNPGHEVRVVDHRRLEVVNFVHGHRLVRPDGVEDVE